MSHTLKRLYAEQKHSPLQGTVSVRQDGFSRRGWLFIDLIFFFNGEVGSCSLDIGERQGGRG